MRFLTRFQRLERSRASQAPARSATGERFQALEPPAPLPEVHPAGLERFAPPVEPALELRPRTDGQPFVRCPACGVDSALGTRRCSCGTALDSLEAVSFNAALWDRHRAELAGHEAERRQTREADLEAARTLQQQRQAMGEAIAREVAAREGVVASGAAARWAGALLLLGFLALVLLPRGPGVRAVFAFLLGAVAVRAVIGWARSRSGSD